MLRVLDWNYAMNDQSAFYVVVLYLADRIYSQIRQAIENVPHRN